MRYPMDALRLRWHKVIKMSHTTPTTPINQPKISEILSSRSNATPGQAQPNKPAHAETFNTMPLKAKALYVMETYLRLMDGPDRRSHLLLWSMFAFVIIALIWAKFAILDEVTHASGKVIPSRQIQIVQNLDGGIVREILTKEGETVAANQIIMHIDDTRFASSYRESIMERANLSADIARLSALAEGKDLKLPDELPVKFPKVAENARSVYSAQKNEQSSKVASLDEQVRQKASEIEELKSRISQLERSYGLVSKELNMTRPLIKAGAVSEVEVLRLEREANDLQGQLNAAKLSVPRALAALNEANSKINEINTSNQASIYDELNKAKSRYSQLEETLTALKDRVVRTAVRSPVKGIVKKININTIGGVITPGMNIVEIVPLDDSLLIEARIDPKDIGFIHPGANAMVKLTAYDYSIYGGLKGKVEQISADSMLDDKDRAYYQIRVRTQKNYIGNDHKKLVIIPGMLTNVDVITGRKSVLDYILKPVLKTKQNALTER